VTLPWQRSTAVGMSLPLRRDGRSVFFTQGFRGASDHGEHAFQLFNQYMANAESRRMVVKETPTMETRGTPFSHDKSFGRHG